MIDERSFLKILRITEKTEKIDRFWKKITKYYLNLVNTQNLDDTNTLEFLHEVFNNNMISEQLIFFLEYIFSNYDDN